MRARHAGQFKSGHPKLPGAGRAPGTPNKRTVFIKGMLEDAVVEMGGLERLLAWIRERPENEFAFWTSMVMRLLPVRLKGTGEDGAFIFEIKHEDLARQMMERGLPPVVFGNDKPQPIKIIDARQSET